MKHPGRRALAVAELVGLAAAGIFRPGNREFLASIGNRLRLE